MDNFTDEPEPYFMEIPLDRLLEYCDPTLDDPWDCGLIPIQDVLDHADGDMEEHAILRTWPYDERHTLEYNVLRIAELVKHGIGETREDIYPISIDVGLWGYLPSYLISDGNHRVAAAKILGLKTLTVAIEGDIQKAEDIFWHDVSPDEWEPCMFANEGELKD